MGITKLFVYGSLKSGFSNNDIIRKLGRKIGDVETVEKYPMFSNKSSFIEYPYLINEPGNGRIIKGELWELHHTKLKYLDEFESKLYKKIKIIVSDKDNKKINCLVYVKVKPVDYSSNKLLNEWKEK